MEDFANRRVHPRHTLYFPVQLDLEPGRRRLAVTRNVSRSGTLVFLNSKVNVGDRVELMMCVNESIARNPKLVGRVRRLHQLEDGRQWRYAAALQFDGELPVEPLEWRMPWESEEAPRWNGSRHLS